MTKRHEFSNKTKTQAALRANGKCEICGLKPKRFEYDHIIADELGGDNTLENCQAICQDCHKHKTHKKDRPAIAKAQRLERKSLNVFKKSSFPTNRNGKFKRRMDGTLEVRK